MPLQKKLKKKGFNELSHQDHPICRWGCDGVLIDIVPTGENVLGFSNTWYKDAIETANIEKINQSTYIKIISAPCFIATKLEAFMQRGKSDFLSSHDLEDIITIIDGRSEITDDIKNSSFKIIQFISSHFSTFFKNNQFLQALPGHLNYTHEYENRKNTVLHRMNKIIELGASNEST